MSDTTESTKAPAEEFDLDLTVRSLEVAERLLDAGASDKAVDAAGGDGAAARLRAKREKAAAA